MMCHLHFSRYKLFNYKNVHIIIINALHLNNFYFILLRFVYMVLPSRIKVRVLGKVFWEQRLQVGRPHLSVRPLGVATTGQADHTCQLGLWEQPLQGRQTTPVSQASGSSHYRVGRPHLSVRPLGVATTGQADHTCQLDLWEQQLQGRQTTPVSQTCRSSDNRTDRPHL